MDNTGLTKKFIWVFPCNTLQNKPFGQPKCWIGMGVFPHKTILHKQEARFDLKAIVCTPLVCRLATLKMWHELIWWWESFHCVLCLVAQLCLTLCDHMNCSLPCSSVHGDLPGKNTGVGCHALLQGIFPTQGSNPGLPHCTADSLPVELPELPQLNNCVLRTSQVQSLVLEDTHTATSVTWTTTALLPRSSQSGVHVGLGKGDHFMWAQIISWSETLPTALPTPHPLQTFLLTTCPG